MKLKHLELPTSIEQTQDVSGIIGFTESVKIILKGYGYHDSQSVSQMPFGEYFKMWQDTNINNTFGEQEFHRDQGNFSTHKAINEIFSALNTPESVKKEIQRRIFSLVDESIDIGNNITSLTTGQSSEIIRLSNFPEKLNLLCQMFSLLRDDQDSIHYIKEGIIIVIRNELNERCSLSRYSINNEETVKLIDNTGEQIINDIDNLFKQETLELTDVRTLIENSIKKRETLIKEKRNVN